MQVMARRIHNRMKERLAELDLNINTFVNLMELRQEDGISQKRLGTLAEFPEYATSRNVDVMVEAGLVERRPDPNSRRSVRIFLTAQGRRLANKLPKIVAETNKEFLDNLKISEQKELVRLLRKLAEIPCDGNPRL